MATHSSILAWRIPWTEEPGGLQSVGSQRVRHDWAAKQQQGRRNKDGKGGWHQMRKLSHKIAFVSFNPPVLGFQLYKHSITSMFQHVDVLWVCFLQGSCEDCPCSLACCPWLAGTVGLLPWFWLRIWLFLAKGGRAMMQQGRRCIM